MTRTTNRKGDKAKGKAPSAATAVREHATLPRQKEPHRGAPKPEALPFRRPSSNVAILYGYHAVREALRARRRKLLDLYVTKAAADKLMDEIRASGVAAHIVAAEDLTRRLGPQAVHQGLMLEAQPLEPLDLTDIVLQSGIVLVLDQITDPHNVGAIVRTAAAFGVDAIVTTERHSPEFSGVLAKAASGGLDHLPIVEVVNLARALDQLGEKGYLRIGLDSDGPDVLETAPLRIPLALVLGGEGKGLRRLSRTKCDLLARLDMPGAIKSLNVSNACAIALCLARQKLRAR